MATGDVRERDIGSLRDVVAALRAPPADVTPAPDAGFGAPVALLSHDPAGPGVRWRSLALLRELLDVEDLVLHVEDPKHRTWCFGQEVCPGGPEDFWYEDMGPGGPPDTPNDISADLVEFQSRYWAQYGRCVLDGPELADWGVVLTTQDIPRRELEERAARLDLPLAHSMITAWRVAPGRHAEIMGIRPGWGTFSERDRGILELLKPHFVDAWRRSCVTSTPLTGAQRGVLELVREGRTNRQVARELGISEATVRTHLQNAYAALGVTNRVAAVAAAFGSPSGGLDASSPVDRTFEQPAENPLPGQRRPAAAHGTFTG